MNYSLRSLASACVPSFETLGRVANGATALILLLPAYDAARAAIRVAADAGVTCLPNQGLTLNIVHPILKWQTFLNTAQIADGCFPKVFATTEMAVLAISAVLLSIHCAKKCLRKEGDPEVLLSPRTRESLANLKDNRGTLVRKPLPALPSGEKPPAPPSGNFEEVVKKLKGSCAIQ